MIAQFLSVYFLYSYRSYLSFFKDSFMAMKKNKVNLIVPIRNLDNDK